MIYAPLCKLYPKYFLILRYKSSPIFWGVEQAMVPFVVPVNVICDSELWIKMFEENCTQLLQKISLTHVTMSRCIYLFTFYLTMLSVVQIK
jgi:hypothetical protein